MSFTYRPSLTTSQPSLILSIRNFFQEILQDKKTLGIIVILNLLAFFPFLCNTIYTNHSLPNLFPEACGFPSYRTFLEHRFAQDLLYVLQGCPGSTFLLLLFALIIQILNGYLASKLLGFARRGQIILFCLFICLYPYVWDYYGFATDHLSFVLGDAFMILALLSAKRRSITGYLAGILLIVLSLGMFPSKLSLLACLGILYLLVQVTRNVRQEDGLRNFLKEFVYISALMLGGALLYFLSLKLAQATYLYDHAHNAGRLYIAPPSEWIDRITAALKQVWLYWKGSVRKQGFIFPRHFAHVLFLLSALALLVSFLRTVWWNQAPIRKKILFGLAFLVLLALLPIGLELSNILNGKSGGGRLLTQWAYIWPATICGLYGWNKALNVLLKTVTAIAAYFLILISNDVYTASDFRFRQEQALLVRIADRVEPHLKINTRYKLIAPGHPDLTQTARFGHYLTPHIRREVNILQPMLQTYRRPDFLTSLMINKISFGLPSRADADLLNDKFKALNVWPEEGCFAVEGDCLLLKLRPVDAITPQNTFFAD